MELHISESCLLHFSNNSLRIYSTCTIFGCTSSRVLFSVESCLVHYFVYNSVRRGARHDHQQRHRAGSHRLRFRAAEHPLHGGGHACYTKPRLLIPGHTPLGGGLCNTAMLHVFSFPCNKVHPPQEGGRLVHKTMVLCRSPPPPPQGEGYSGTRFRLGGKAPP